MQKVFIGLISVVVAIVLSFGLCACDNKKGENIDLPADIDLVANKSQPLLKVYDKDAETIVEMQMEEYLMSQLWDLNRPLKSRLGNKGPVGHTLGAPVLCKRHGAPNCVFERLHIREDFFFSF